MTRSDRVNRAGLIASEVACDVRVPGLLAQLVERLVYTQLVAGSSPAQSTMRSSPWESGPLWGVSAIPVFRDERAGFDSRRRARHCSRAEMGAVERCGLASTGFSWACFRQGYSFGMRAT